MVGRSKNHPSCSVGKNHCLKYIDHLGNVGHLDPVRVFVENVQAQGRHHSIPHGILLEQVSGIGPRLHLVPGTPFINQKINFTFRVKPVHHFNVLLYNIFYINCFCE